MKRWPNKRGAGKGGVADLCRAGRAWPALPDRERSAANAIHEKLYDDGRQLFLRGKHEEAVERFKRIYEDTLDLRDVTEIVDDYYGLPREEWLAKYQARFKK